jgi:hypothetical protein
MKPRHLVLAAGLLVAAAFAFFGDKSPAGDVVEAAPRNAARAGATPAAVTTPLRASAPSAKQQPAPMVLALVPREQVREQGAGADAAFNVQSWAPPPPPPPKPAPPPPPVAPPLPFTYLGKVLENGVWEVFLARGSETLIVKNQMVLDGVYRIDNIAPPSMTMTYLPLKQVQQINIGVPE